MNEQCADLVQICPNLHYLGKRSVTKISEGIRIVTLGGRLDPAIVGGLSNEQYLPFHTLSDSKSLLGANSADILLSAMWPAHVRKGSSKPSNESGTDAGHEHISELCAVLKPRYHLSTSVEFFEREPFHHPASPDRPDYHPVTRFISLAAQGNVQKQKSLYAFTLPLTVDYSSALPAGSTPSPFVSNLNQRKRQLDHNGSGRNHQYSDHERPRKGQRMRSGARQPPPGPQECFFCLSNPNLSTHLVASIGDEAYLTTAKGPLTTSDTNNQHGLSFPCHMLIIPLTHSPTLASIDGENGARQKTFEEMTSFRNALQRMVSKASNGKLGAVTYEISKGDGVHTHWQFLPVPADLVKKGLVEAAFRVEAENLRYPAFEVRDPGIGQGEGDFFRAWLWTPSEEGIADEATEKCITLPFDYKTRFSLQYGRIVMAKLLSLESRIQWRDCAQSEEEEKQEIAIFNKTFAEFDFTT